MTDHAAGLQLEQQHTGPDADRLRRYGWRVGAHALQPLQRHQVLPPVRRAGILRRMLAALLTR